MKPLPDPALLRIFSEVWTDYAAFLEPEHPDLEIRHFILDVQSQIRYLFGPNTDYVQRRLMANRHCLHYSRAALGLQFLRSGLWPTKNYFSK